MQSITIKTHRSTQLVHYSKPFLHIISLSSLLICSSALVGFSAPEQKPLPSEFQKEIEEAAGGKFNKKIPTAQAAIEQEEHSVLSLLIASQPDIIDAPIIVGGEAYTPFEYSFALARKNVKAAKMLIDAGADLTKTGGYLGKSVPIVKIIDYARNSNWKGCSKEETEIMDIFTYALRFGTVNNLVKNNALSRALAAYYAPAAHRLIQAGATVKTEPGTNDHVFLKSAEEAVQNRRKNNQERKAAAMLKLDEEKVPRDLGQIVGTYMDDEE